MASNSKFQISCHLDTETTTPQNKTLEIISAYEQCCPILQFIDTICLKCPKLEEFYYEGSSRPYECIDREGLKISDFEDHEKFLNLKKLFIEFAGDCSCLYDWNSEEPNVENFEIYKAHFSARCPNLEKPLKWSTLRPPFATFWSE